MRDLTAYEGTLCPVTRFNSTRTKCQVVSMAAPSTPSTRGDKGYADYIRQLNAKWSLDLRLKETAFSPSQLAHVEAEKREAAIRFLYYRDRRRLETAIDTFEEEVHSTFTPAGRVEWDQHHVQYLGDTLWKHVEPVYQYVKSGYKSNLGEVPQASVMPSSSLQSSVAAQAFGPDPLVTNGRNVASQAPGKKVFKQTTLDFKPVKSLSSLPVAKNYKPGAALQLHRLQNGDNNNVPFPWSQSNYEERESSPSPLGRASVGKSFSNSTTEIVPFPAMTRDSENRSMSNGVTVHTKLFTTPPPSFRQNSTAGVPTNSAATSFSAFGASQTTANTSFTSIGSTPQRNGSAPSTVVSRRLSSEPALASTLSRYSPFVEFPDQFQLFPLRYRYELLRVSLHTGLDMFDLYPVSSRYGKLPQDYRLFWTQLQGRAEKAGMRMPERSSLEAWESAASGFEGVQMSGELHYDDERANNVFKLTLNPLRLERSNRLARKFGHDRFFKLVVPWPGHKWAEKLSAHNEKSAKDGIISWLTGYAHPLAGRAWKTFFLRDHRNVKKRKPLKDNENIFPRDADSGKESSKKWDVNLFAVNGCDFHKSGPLRRSETLANRPIPMKVEDMLNWMIPFEDNSDQTYLKLFSRIGLGLTDTTPTVTLESNQIYWRPRDVMSSTNKVMNDGCDLISPALAWKVANCLGITGPIPSAFQARIAGAKGLWIVDMRKKPFLMDPDDPRSMRLTISPSQTKFKSHDVDLAGHTLPEDSGRMTFEVRDYSKPLRQASLFADFVPILEERGVERGVLDKLIRRAIKFQVEEAKAALDDRFTFRQWVHDSIAQETGQNRSATESSLPPSNRARMMLLLDGGFDHRECYFLNKLASTCMKEHIAARIDDFKIPLGRSTMAFCVPDMTGTLKEGTVHLSFSSIFLDPVSRFQDTVLNDIDVLVSRMPANRLSDIQKVRAVISSELSGLKDVIVFSTQGQSPLADMLSGGDYDGDKVWVCWEPEIVAPFRNAARPDEPSPADLGIVKDETKFKDLNSPNPIGEMIQGAFLFAAEENLLGYCTNYYRTLIYNEQSMSARPANWIATLLGYLVDRDKQGYRFGNDEWKCLQRRLGLDSKPLRNPAYKDDKAPSNISHIVDFLKFGVVEQAKMDALARFAQSGFEIGHEKQAKRDADLDALWAELQRAARTDNQLDACLKKLVSGIQEINRFYTERVGPPFQQRLEYSYNAVVEKCLRRFEELTPEACGVGGGGSGSGSSSSSSSCSSRQHPRLSRQLPITAAASAGGAATTSVAVAVAAGRNIIHRDDSGVGGSGGSGSGGAAASAHPFSDWNLLRALAAFGALSVLSQLPWHLAPLQLAYLKLSACGRLRPVDTEMYFLSKPDPRALKRQRAVQLEEREWGEDSDNGYDDAELCGFFGDGDF